MQCNIHFDCDLERNKLWYECWWLHLVLMPRIDVWIVLFRRMSRH
jgi:hypothetical protein